MSKSKLALGVLLVAPAIVSHSAPADAADDVRPKTETAAAKKPHRVVKRFKTGNGYRCHGHLTRTKPERGADWHSRGRHRSLRHCFKIRPKAGAAGSSAWVLPSYVVRCESGGQPRVVNYSNPMRPAGLYQIITATWLGYGGGAFAPTADLASIYEQGVIARRVLAGQGPQAWECW